MDYPALLWLSFVAGIYAPLGSPCVIILYPGYLAFLAGTDEENRASPFLLGLAVACGVLISLLLGGSLLGLVVQALGPAARALLQPAVSLLLFIFALVLIFDITLPPVLQGLPLPRAGTPAGSALTLGLFMGLLILPCNTAIILFLLTLATSVGTAVESTGLFLTFGIGMVLPLLLLAGISRIRSRQVLGFLTRHRIAVQRLAGIGMLLIAAVYLVLFFLPGLP
jgi:cytochrome c-type biogenesis protein